MLTFSKLVLIALLSTEITISSVAQQETYPCKARSGGNPSTKWSGFAWVPLDLGKIHVESIFPLSTTPELWRSLTGRIGEESDNVVLEVPSWGKQIKLIGAPLKGDLSIASAKLTNPLVFHQRSNDDDFSKWPFAVSGLFGNALFLDRTVVVDLVHKRFGVSQARNVCPSVSSAK